MPRRQHTIAIIATIAGLAAGCSDDGETTPGGTTGASTGASGGAGGDGAAGGAGGLGGGGAGGGADVTCGESLCQGSQPAASCMMCIGASCTDELADCQNDPGASSGGAGGAGGAGGGTPCDTCAAMIFDPSMPTAALCPSSSLLWDALLTCACGDPASPGSCNP